MEHDKALLIRVMCFSLNQTTKYWPSQVVGDMDFKYGR